MITKLWVQCKDILGEQYMRPMIPDDLAEVITVVKKQVAAEALESVGIREGIEATTKRLAMLEVKGRSKHAAG